MNNIKILNRFEFNKLYNNYFNIELLYNDYYNLDFENKLDFLESLNGIVYCIKNINNKYIINNYIDDIMNYYLYININFAKKLNNKIE